MAKFNPKRKPKLQDDALEEHLDALDEYMEFRAKILPELRSMLLKGASDKKILAAFTSQVSARLVTIALTEPDNAKALSAVKDLLDRVNGRATETRNVKHTMENLSDQELNALLLTEMQDAEDDKSVQ